MPNFKTPGPISVVLDLYIGDVQIIASERTDTVVEVRATDESKPNDVKTAEQATVEFADGRLVIKVPKPRGNNFIGFGTGKDRSVDVRVEVPTGSDVRGSAALGAFSCTGEFGECDLRTNLGDIRLEGASAAQLNTDGGAIVVSHVTGNAGFTTGTGEVRVARVGGATVLKNSSGQTRLGDIGGKLQVRSSAGDITIERAGADVDAKTSAGRIQIGEVARGLVVVESGGGGLEVGIRKGSAVLLDLHSQSGTVCNMLDVVDGPEPNDEQVEVRARTQFGDIVISRSSAGAN
jgi:DUF4097 and DUF4098 domain-containing protein YvlB